MSDFFEIFNPGLRYQRQQKDFDKVAVVPTRKGGRGPLQIDLDAGTMVVPIRQRHLSEDAVSSATDDHEAVETDVESGATVESEATESKATESKATAADDGDEGAGSSG